MLRLIICARMIGPPFQTHHSRLHNNYFQVCPSQHPAHHRRQEGYQDPGRALAAGKCSCLVFIRTKNKQDNYDNCLHFMSTIAVHPGVPDLVVRARLHHADLRHVPGLRRLHRARTAPQLCSTRKVSINGIKSLSLLPKY